MVTTSKKNLKIKFSRNNHIIPSIIPLLFHQISLISCLRQNILVFNSTNYRAGHSAFTSNGDLIIEYSYQNQRLFYGLKSNGKHYFKENGIYTPTKSLTIEDNPFLRYESRNLFISLNNSNDNKEY